MVHLGAAPHRAATGAAWRAMSVTAERVQERVLVGKSGGRSWSTMDCRGMSASPPATRDCCSKQKHSVLWKWAAAREGTMLGTDWETMSWSVGLRTTNWVVLTAPG